MAVETRKQLHGFTPLILASLLGGMSMFSCKQAISAENKRVPNILLILTDDKYYDNG